MLKKTLKKQKFAEGLESKSWIFLKLSKKSLIKHIIGLSLIIIIKFIEGSMVNKYIS